MIFNQTITELIPQRHSVRTYTSEPISDQILSQIESYFDQIETPFEQKPRFKLLNSNNHHGKPIKLGTYGMIKNASYFLGVAIEKNNLDYETIGYAFEKLVLYCTSLGLGTCWIGGTFNKKNFTKLMNVRENEIFPIVSPLGYEADKKRFIESLISRNSRNRFDFSELFFNGNFSTPLTKEEAGPYYQALENVRLAPSAVNKQSWRIIKNDQLYHFYIDQDTPAKRIDIGIALCHFHLTALESGLSGTFIQQSPSHQTDFKYVISWRQE